MAEVIAETILPGTYIEVRPEGLLQVRAISTGNVGIIGTAEKGEERTQILSNFEEGRANFGEVNGWDINDPDAKQGNLTLVRALRLLFDNGARTVYARRVVNSEVAQAAVHQVLNETGNAVLSLRAKSSGTWGNRLMYRVEEAEESELIGNEKVVRQNGAYALSAQQISQPESSEDSIGSVIVTDEGIAKRYQLRLTTATSETVQVNPADRSLSFVVRPSSAAEIRANYWVPAEGLRKVILRFGNVQDVFVTPSIEYLKQRIEDERSPSNLVEIVENDAIVALNVLMRVTSGFVSFSGGENGAVSKAEFQTALDSLVEENIQILVVAGLSFSEFKASILGHVEKTENLGRERIALIGADNSKVDKILENTNDVADKRVVLVAPGLNVSDSETGRSTLLPPYLAATAVAGKLSSLSPHVSATNKTLAGIEGLDTIYNSGQLKALVQNRVLTLQRKRGVRIVKGITSDDGAFQQISIRRIVDYVKEGTRLGCNPYIGKLNNLRVRENLRTTLDSFLADLVVREFLTGYNLTVFADRTMEIRGEVQVIMDINPTFSIDVIRVTMNLS